jgi:RNA-binding protein
MYKESLVAASKSLEPVLRIGKSGLAEGVIEEIKRQLKQKKLIKIKLLKSFIGDKDRKLIAEEIAEKTGSELAHQVGFVVVLHKK